MRKVLFIVFLVSFSGNSCMKKDSITSIAGSWSYIENDSIYGEVVFTQTHFWEYTQNTGEIFLPYILKNDSIQFINWNGDPYIKAKFLSVNQDEFYLVRDDMKVRYNRLTVPIDTAALIQGDEEILGEYIYKGLLVRKFDWESNKKKSSPSHEPHSE